MSDDAIERDYQAAGFHQRIGYGKRPALIVIDMVAAYTDERHALYAPGAVTAWGPICRLIDSARDHCIPVIYTNISYRMADEAGSVWSRKVPLMNYFYAGSNAGEWSQGIEPRDEEMVITKQYASCFFGTNLSSRLTALGVDTLIVTGVSTSGCVRATVVDAISLGFIPIVAREAVGDRHPGPHEASLFDIDAKYGDVVSVQDVLDHFDAYGC